MSKPKKYTLRINKYSVKDFVLGHLSHYQLVICSYFKFMLLGKKNLVPAKHNTMCILVGLVCLSQWKYKTCFKCPILIFFKCLYFLVLQTKVQEAKVSGNLDAPEGGLDAVMQAIACEVSFRLS